MQNTILGRSVLLKAAHIIIKINIGGFDSISLLLKLRQTSVGDIDTKYLPVTDEPTDALSGVTDNALDINDAIEVRPDGLIIDEPNERSLLLMANFLENSP